MIRGQLTNLYMNGLDQIIMADHYVSGQAISAKVSIRYSDTKQIGRVKSIINSKVFILTNHLDFGHE